MLDNPRLMAEREGFEPSIPLLAYRFSKPTHSTALPPLQVVRRVAWWDEPPEGNQGFPRGGLG